METKAGDLAGLAETSVKTIQKETEALPTPKDPAPTQAASKVEDAPNAQDVAATEDVPDPDEDDLDDLDGNYILQYRRPI